MLGRWRRGLARSQEFVCLWEITKIIIVSYQKYYKIMNRLSLLKQCVSEVPVSIDNLKTIKVDRKDLVGTIWLDSPHNYNAISFRMIDELNLLFTSFDKDPEVKIILLRSKHPKFFCSGGDFKDVILNFPNDRNNGPRLFSLLKVMRSVKKPLISVVDGAALGGGFELCLLTDIIISSDKGYFSLPELKHGLVPGMGGNQHLTRIVGTKLASKLIFTGDVIPASEAARLNIAHVYPSDKFQAQVSKFVDSLVNKSLDALQSAKKAINLAMQTTLDQGLQYQATLFQSLFAKEGAKQGLSAFVEKRKPNFRNL